MPEFEPSPLEKTGSAAPDFASLNKEDRLATLSWYLVVCGMALLALAALCLYLGKSGHVDFFKHKDFAINPIALSQRLLFAGIIAYAIGRIITYARRFRKPPAK